MSADPCRYLFNLKIIENCTGRDEHDGVCGELWCASCPSSLAMSWFFDSWCDSVDACVHCAAHWLGGNAEQQQHPVSAIVQQRNAKSSIRTFVDYNSQTLDKRSSVEFCIRQAGQQPWRWVDRTDEQFIIVHYPCWRGNHLFIEIAIVGADTKGWLHLILLDSPWKISRCCQLSVKSF